MTHPARDYDALARAILQRAATRREREQRRETARASNELARLRLAARAWKRRPAQQRRLGAAIRVPTAVEAQYVLALRRVAAQTEQAAKAAIWHWLPVWFPAATRADADPPTPLTVIDRLRRDLAERQRLASIPADMLDDLQRANRAALNAQFAPVTGGVPLWRGMSADVKSVLSAATRENVNLIRSIPERMLGDVHDVITSGLQRGARVGTIQRELQERFDIGQRRAALIARDQVGKINGQLVQARSQEQGMSGYTWRTSEDERVRPGHRVLDGTHQEWANPPVVDEATGRMANPGEDYQCRCTAEPDVEGLLDNLLGDAGD